MVYKLDLLRTPGAVNRDDPNAGYVYRFRLSGNFVLEGSEEFNLLMNTLVGGGMKKVVFDLSELKYIDSTGVGIIISVAKQLRARGGDLVFLNVQARILEIFNLVKLNDFIQFFKGEKQIFEHFFTV